jgi:PAS domain S-box-containing protein
MLQAIFNNVPVMIALWDTSGPGGHLLLVNQEWERVLGWTIEEAQRIDLSVATLPDPRERQRVVEDFRKADGRWVNNRPQRRDGKTLDSLWAQVGLPGGLTWVLGQDLTERRHTEAELRRAEEERCRAQERLLQSNEELRALAARVQALREEESTRIAREVHDELGPMLTALHLDVAWLERSLGQGGPPAADKLVEKLRSMSGMLDIAADAVHRIASELRPAVLDRLGLDAAVEWYVGEFQKRTLISCGLHSRFDSRALDALHSITVFRILQEALTNAARHSLASRIEVRLRADAGRVRLEVTDNGKGIPEDCLNAASSLGLLGMHERARLLGGDVTIRRNPGGGTTVAAWLPR